MDDKKLLEKIIRIQNKLLLKKIADIKFTNQDDKDIFIECYFKKNYQTVFITNNNKIEETYKKKLKKMNI
jgi:hypothetical protein